MTKSRYVIKDRTDGLKEIPVKGHSTLRDLKALVNECRSNLSNCKPEDREYWQQIGSEALHQISIIERSLR